MKKVKEIKLTEKLHTSINEFKQHINETMSNNEAIKLYNSFISFVENHIDRIISREGSLPTAYFEDGLESRLDDLTNKIATAEDIKNNISEIQEVHRLLKDGLEGIRMSSY